MKVRLLTSRAGQGFAEHAGDEVDLPRAEALRYLRDGLAEPITDGIESASVKPADNAALPETKHRVAGSAPKSARRPKQE